MVYSLISVAEHRTDFEMTFDASRMIERRKRKGWREADLAHKLGITQQTLSRYETGKRQPPAELLVKMAEVLDTSTDYLLGLVPNPIRSSGLSDDELRVLEEYRARRIVLEREIVNEEIDKIAVPQRDHIRRLINALQKTGKLDSRSNNP